MKGLLVKDIRLVLKNRMAIASMLFIVIIFVLLTGKDRQYSFAIAYVTMLAGIYASSTISMDENGGSLPFLMTLPVTRGVYVAEKYFFVILSCLITCILVMLGFILLRTDLWKVLLIQGSLSFVALSFYYMIMLPLQIKYNDKSRVALFGLIMICVVIVLLSKRATSYINAANIWLDWSSVKSFAVNTINGILSLNKLFVGVTALLIWLICWAVSFGVSLGIMYKKEF